MKFCYWFLKIQRIIMRICCLLPLFIWLENIFCINYLIRQGKLEFPFPFRCHEKFLLCSYYISWHLWGWCLSWISKQEEKLKGGFFSSDCRGSESQVTFSLTVLESNIACFSFLHFHAWYKSDLEIAKWTKTTALEIFLQIKLGKFFF